MYHTLPTRSAALSAIHSDKVKTPWWTFGSLGKCRRLVSKVMVQEFVSLEGKAPWLDGLVQELSAFCEHAQVPDNASQILYHLAIEMRRCDMIEALYATGLRPNQSRLHEFCAHFEVALDPVIDLFFKDGPKLRDNTIAYIAEDPHLLARLIPYVGDQLFSDRMLAWLKSDGLLLLKAYGADLNRPDLLRSKMIMDYDRRGCALYRAVGRLLFDECGGDPELVALSKVTHHYWRLFATQDEIQDFLALGSRYELYDLFHSVAFDWRVYDVDTKTVMQASGLSLELRLFLLSKARGDVRELVQQCKLSATQAERDWVEDHVVPILSAKVLALWE